jgi:homoserine O-acetyltransferase
MESASIGLVDSRYFTFAGPPNEMKLESGETLSPVTLAYETYGELNRNRTNAVLIAHALSGDAHVAGLHATEDQRPGWWNFMIGPGKPIDTDRFFVICSNVIGGCKGSTGPLSVNPKTSRCYGLEFPVVTIGDMVRAQSRLIDHLGITRLLSVIGGSMGGMQALEWAIEFPDRVASAVPIATTARLSAQGIAFDAVGRQAIYSDANWKRGNYPNEGVIPTKGLGVARMLAHITYLSEASMDAKFGRRLREKERYGYDFSTDFEVESYLHHQSENFIKRFDANSYLFITKAINYFDLHRDYGSLENAFRPVKADMLVLSFSSDWLFPSEQSREIVRALIANRRPVTFCEIPAPYGHDAFLLRNEMMESMIGDFLNNELEKA